MFPWFVPWPGNLSACEEENPTNKSKKAKLLKAFENILVSMICPAQVIKNTYMTHITSINVDYAVNVSI